MVATIRTLQNYSTVGGYGSPPLDPNGPAQVAPGGTSSALNLTAAQVVKAAPGRLCKILITGTIGTGGSYTFNDTTTTGAAAAANQILTLVGTTAVGTIISLDWPCASGIVCSAFATGGAPVVSISFN